ncbi:hypothetical protein B7486_36695, partial [cyanobacterium TDX16]
GVEVDWQGFYRHQQRSRLPLPTYPFERHRFWVEPNPDRSRDRQQSVRNKTQTSSPNLELQNSSESLDDSKDALDNFTGVEDKQDLSELAIEEILDRQLDLMSQQLDFVHNLKSV